MTCGHSNAIVSVELQTMRCPDCGYVKKLTPEQAMRADFLQDIFPYVQRLEPLISGHKWENDPKEMFALMTFSICVLRDLFRVSHDEVIAASSTLYALAKLRFTHKEGDNANIGAEVEGSTPDPV